MQSIYHLFVELCLHNIVLHFKQVLHETNLNFLQTSGTHTKHKSPQHKLKTFRTVHKKNNCTSSLITLKTNLNKFYILHRRRRQNVIYYSAETKGTTYTSCSWSCLTAQLKFCITLSGRIATLARCGILPQTE